MQLFFLRHGRADRSAWQGDDVQRPLTPQGRARMQQQAQQFNRLGLRVDYVLSSPLVRAVQIAEIVVAALTIKPRLVLDDRLRPGFDLAKLETVLTDHTTAHKLMLVGHEPDFSTVIGRLIGDDQVICKKGGLARIDLDASHALRGTLVWLLPPRALMR